jgi:hypothetical protein
MFISSTAAAVHQYLDTHPCESFLPPRAALPGLGLMQQAELLVASVQPEHVHSPVEAADLGFSPTVTSGTGPPD